MKLRRQKFSLDDGFPSKLGSPEHAYKRRRKAVVFHNIKVLFNRIIKVYSRVRIGVDTLEIKAQLWI